MVLLCHSSECGCFVCDMIVLWGFPLFLILTTYTYILPVPLRAQLWSCPKGEAPRVSVRTVLNAFLSHFLSLDRLYAVTYTVKSMVYGL